MSIGLHSFALLAQENAAAAAAAEMPALHGLDNASRFHRAGSLF
jgi:hypothetical protein